MQFKCDGYDRGWKYRNDCIYLGSPLILATLTLVSIFVSEYLWPQTSRVTWPYSSGHVRRLPSTFYFRARQLNYCCVLPSLNIFVICYASSMINLIKLYSHIIWIINRVTCLWGNAFLPMKAPWVLRLFSTHCFYDVSDGVMARGVLLRVTIKIWPFDDFQVIFYPFRLKKEF